VLPDLDVPGRLSAHMLHHIASEPPSDIRHAFASPLQITSWASIARRGLPMSDKASVDGDIDLINVRVCVRKVRQDGHRPTAARQTRLMSLAAEARSVDPIAADGQLRKAQGAILTEALGHRCETIKPADRSPCLSVRAGPPVSGSLLRPCRAQEYEIPRRHRRPGSPR
jgi:hypothetical protein